jgi:hypothetical protein
MSIILRTIVHYVTHVPCAQMYGCICTVYTGTGTLNTMYTGRGTLNTMYTGRGTLNTVYTRTGTLTNLLQVNGGRAGIRVPRYTRRVRRIPEVC